MTDLPVVCTLTPATLRTRREGLLAGLLGRAMNHEELPEGHCLRCSNLLAFVTAAFFESAGCFAFWVWLRRGASPAIVLLGTGSLVTFAVALTCSCLGAP